MMVTYVLTLRAAEGYLLEMKAVIRIPECLSRLVVIVAFSLLLLALPLNGAAYIKFDGIDGEATDADHKDWITIQSLSWGMEQEVDAATGGGAGAGKVKFDKLTIKKSVDKASPLLMRATALAEPIPTMTLELTRAGSARQGTYLSITMTDVIITSVRTSASTSDSVPEETLSLNYSTVDFAYTPQNPDGSSGDPVRFTWNLSTNTE